jgi:hypothetical protein
VVLPHAIDPVVPPGPASAGFTPPSVGAPLLPLLLLELDASDSAPLDDPPDDVEPELDAVPELPPELLLLVAAPSSPPSASVASVPLLDEPPHPSQMPIATAPEPRSKRSCHCVSFPMASFEQELRPTSCPSRTMGVRYLEDVATRPPWSRSLPREAVEPLCNWR